MIILMMIIETRLPLGLSGEESTCGAGDTGSIPGSGRSPGGGNGSPLQHSCLENPMAGEAWRTTVRMVTKSDTTEWLSTWWPLKQGRARVVLKWKWKCSSLSRARLFATPWTGAPGKNAGVGCHFLLQGIFPTQGSNPGLPHCRQILYSLSYPKNDQ